MTEEIFARPGQDPRTGAQIAAWCGIPNERMDGMIRYWDKSERERAELQEEDVRAMLDVERMEKGLTKPRPPAMRTEPDCEPKTVQFFRVGYKSDRYYGSREFFDSIFFTAEDAQAFINLGPRACSSDYQTGDVKYAVEPEDLAIEAVNIATREEINSLKPRLIERKAAREENSKSQTVYDELCTKWDSGADDIWEDWHKQRRTTEKHQSVMDTWEEYKALAGDERTAATFLGKAFSALDIAAAFEWFEITPPEGYADEQIAAMEDPS